MEIFAARHNAERRQLEAAQEVDGLLYHFVMPDDILETRAAEYHIEPTEVDLLMDIVLYEQFLEPEGDLPPLLFRAGSVEEARQGYIATILALKNRLRPTANNWRTVAQRAQFMRDKGCDQVWIDAITEDALEPIRNNHRMSAEVLVEKSLTIRRNVYVFQQERERAAKQTDRDRAMALRAARMMIEGETE